MVALALAMVVTIAIGAFGVAAAIAVAVVAVAAAIAFETLIQTAARQQALGLRCGLGPSRSGTSPRPRSPSASVRLALVEVAFVWSPDRLVLRDLGGGGLGGQLEFELGSVEHVCCLVGSHQW